MNIILQKLVSIFRCTPKIELADLYKYTNSVELEFVHAVDGKMYWVVTCPKQGIKEKGKDGVRTVDEVIEKMFYRLHSNETALTRPIWVMTVGYIWAWRHGCDRPNRNLLEYAEAMAQSYYDEPEELLSPAEAVDLEISYS